MVCGRRRSRREDRSLKQLPRLPQTQAGVSLRRGDDCGTAKPVSLAHFLPEFETEMQNGWFAAAAEAAGNIDR